MGLFRRLRSSSTTAPPPDPPAGISALPPSTSTPFLASPPQPKRPGLPPPSPSSASLASRVSRRPWNRKKTQELVGIPYEDVSTTPIHDQKRTTMIYIGPPAATLVSPVQRADTHDEDKDEVARRKRLSSGKFKQDGGVLGRLGFEDVPAKDNHEETQEQYPLSSGPPSHMVPETAAEKYEALVPSSEVSEGRKSEEMELLDSTDRRNRFWRVKGRPRRSSRTGSDIEDDIRSGSPTPRKSSLPNASLELISPANHSTSDLHQPRPSQLRRPSSSFFQNPFGRSASRASLALPDLDGQVVDDGSFQLRGFRHVSGMSDVEDPGLDGYLSHVRMEATAALELPPDDPPVRPYISRPSSVAASLASVDDLVANSGRVSVAAFRKGIRRPSEGPATMSDIGHGERNGEDEVPLGMLQHGFGASRTRSVASLSSARNDVDIVPRRLSPSPTPSPTASLAFNVKRHNRNGGGSGSGGFVLKSAKTTRGTSTPEALERAASGASQPVSFASPPPTRPASPVLPDSQEVMESPIGSTPIDGYFSARSPIITTVKHGNHISIQGTDFVAVAQPISTDVSHARPPPPVEPISVPQPGDTTPASIDLPLPPDEMPATPPRRPFNLVQSEQTQPPEPSSPLKTRLLDEPLRMLSGLWTASPPPEAEGIDTGLVIDSMRTLGDGDEGVPAQKLESTDIPRPTTQPILLNITAVSSDEKVRPSLQSRLTNAAAGLSRPSLPQLKTANLESADVHATERMRSPVSEKGTASPVISTVRTIPFSLARATAPRVKAVVNIPVTRKSKSKWSSSDSEVEVEVKHVRAPSRRAPGGPRKWSVRSPPMVVTIPGAQTPSSEGDKDTSSEDEPLAAVRAKASRSSLSLASLSNPSLLKVSPASAPAPPLPPIVNPFKFGPVISAPSRPEPGHSQQTGSPSRSQTQHGFRGSVQDPLRDLSAATGISRPTASPASSQSGVTSDSLGQNLTTPRESYSASTTHLGQSQLEGHSRDSSRDLELLGLPSHSKPRPDNGHGHYPRRGSLDQSSQWQQPHYRPISPAPMHMPVTPMDPGVRAMMKQHWQQQYMAAALRASEDEWERASSVSGHTSPPIPIPLSSPGFGQPYPPFPMYGYPSAQTGVSLMPWMFPFQANPSSPTGGYPQYPRPGVGAPGMYNYGTGAQSVFGDEFGPSPGTRNQFRSHSTTALSPDATSGRYRDPRLEFSSNSSPLGKQKYSLPTSSTHPISKAGDWSELPTPRKPRPSTHFIN